MNSEQFHIAFYRFVRIIDAPSVAAALRALSSGLSGNILVADEGINGTLAGEAAALDRFEQALGADLRLGGLFAGMRLHRSACHTPPFRRLKVHLRSEILPLGVGNVDAVGRRGRQLSACEWHELLADSKTVVIDNRNHFEYRLGRFRGAVDPQVANFRDLPPFIATHAPTWKAEGKTVAMYCTGGIRCEKTAAWMADAYGLEVLQLGGGILGYLAESPHASQDWQGECFVFDNRIALDAQLQETTTTAAEVYAGDPGDPGEAWRLQRATRLDKASG